MNRQTAAAVASTAHAAQPAIRTVHCICYEDTDVGGVDWWPTAEARTSPEASEYLANTWRDTKKVVFDLDVPATASKKQINRLVDDAYWAKAYEDSDSACRLISVIPALH